MEGEPTDANGLLYLRARYYDPALAVFNTRDPFEGTIGRPMSLNGYSWVEGNPIMNTDPSGEQPADPIAIIAQEVANQLGNRPDVLDDMWEEAIRQALQKRGITPTPQLILQVLQRLSLAGITFTSTIPVQQPNGLICTAWEAQLGTCNPIWDNPSTYQSQLQLDPMQTWAIIENTCVAIDPITFSIIQPSTAPIRPNIPTPTSTPQSCPFPVNPAVVRRQGLATDPGITNLINRISSQYPNAKICVAQEYLLSGSSLVSAEIDIELEHAVIEYKDGRDFDRSSFVSQMANYHSPFYNFLGKKVYWFAPRIRLDTFDPTAGKTRFDIIKETGAEPYGRGTTVDQFVNIIGWATN